MSSKHTPGPWTYSHGEHPNFFYIDSPSGDVVYVTASLQPDHVEANARLIAAAPELLQALQLVECVYRKNCVNEGEPSSVLDSMQAAIAKATGARA
ncbi:hypothetical protein E5C33_09265 [Stenotrophomonas maltophilia]|uniref:hypothetical protein n=1 Tax=Stenotrophomonas maltophilia TaxID=40324 RepID=UPI0010769D31|nr:hypothetical protein [Stenotrophomonas maltophilia]TFZ45654.1 hypothetical protein E5C33_09265 [Stenotrophomonas maltophilia]